MIDAVVVVVVVVREMRHGLVFLKPSSRIMPFQRKISRIFLGSRLIRKGLCKVALPSLGWCTPGDLAGETLKNVMSIWAAEHPSAVLEMVLDVQ
jgi:hypothetical protein